MPDLRPNGDGLRPGREVAAGQVRRERPAVPAQPVQAEGEVRAVPYLSEQQQFAEISPKILGNLSLTFGMFSAVSATIFATKDSFRSFGLSFEIYKKIPPNIQKFCKFDRCLSNC